MKLKMYLLVAVLCFMPTFAAWAGTVDVQQAEQVAAAEAALRVTLKLDEPTSKHFGFSSKAEALSSTIGKGFQVYTITTQQLLSTNSTSIAALMVPMDMWDFLVMNQGQAKAVQTVYLKDGGWKPGGFGSAGLAGKLLEVVNAWPESSGYSLRYVQINYISEFVVVSKAGATVGIVPMTPKFSPGSGGNSFNPQEVSSEKDVIDQLRETIKRKQQWTK